MGLGPATLALTPADAPAAAWLAEAAHPWLAPVARRPDWRIALASDATGYRAWTRGRPRDAAPRPVLALDTSVVVLPAWSTREAVVLADDTHACVLLVRPARVDLVGDPASRRWRMTLLRLVHEIAAVRLRPRALDLHAAGVEAQGRAVAICGPKGAGKTTLALRLATSGRCAWMANDRLFVGVDSAASVHGMPTVVAVRASTHAAFPALRHGLPPVERPHLHSLAELTQARPGPAHPAAARVALSPAQVVDRLGLRARPVAPLGALAFPRVDTTAAGWTVERLDPPAVRAELRANLYGARSGRCAPTVFEELAGGFHEATAEAVAGIAERAPGYRVVLGRDAYDDPAFAARLLERLLG